MEEGESEREKEKEIVSDFRVQAGVTHATQGLNKTRTRGSVKHLGALKSESGKEDNFRHVVEKKKEILQGIL